MSIPPSHNASWTRKQDKRGAPPIPRAPVIQDSQSLQELIAICATPPDGSNPPHLHAPGSDWTLSRAAVGYAVLIETNDVTNVLPALERTLYGVVPGRLSDAYHEAVNESAPPDSGRQAPYYSERRQPAEPLRLHKRAASSILSVVNISRSRVSVHRLTCLDAGSPPSIVVAHPSYSVSTSRQPTFTQRVCLRSAARPWMYPCAAAGDPRVRHSQVCWAPACTEAKCWEM
jgi:hypothetical protein